MGGGVRLLGLAPVKRVTTKPLVPQGRGQALNLLPGHALGGALVLLGLRHGGVEVAAEGHRPRVGLAGNAESTVFGFAQVGIGN